MNTFYLDMDGVVADWNGTVERRLNIRTQQQANSNYTVTPEQWAELKQLGHIYRSLDLMPRAEELVTLARQYRDQLGWGLYFLTAVPHRNDVPDAFSDKVLWAQERFPDIEVRFGPYAVDKSSHCRPGDILVDDRKSNCDSWHSAGGTAYLVADRTLSSVINFLAADLERRLAMKSLRENYQGR